MTDDRFPIRAVVIVLGAVGLICVVGEVWLASTQTTIPDSLDRLGIFALGAVAGILSKTSTNAPQEVQVVNDDEDPVPVDGDAGVTTLAFVLAALLVVAIVVATL